MTHVQTFQEDCIALAHEKLARGQMTRRQFNAALTALGALGGAGAMSGSANAQNAKEIVFVNWGGIANEAFGKFYGKPFEDANPGFKVIMDSSGPTTGKIRAMVESKKVTWDTCDGSVTSGIVLGNLGLLEPIDYNIVKKSDLLPGFAYPYTAGPYSFSNVMIYDASKFGSDPPKTWVDFFDLKKYPGKRMLRRDSNCMFETLLMGDGVPMDKVYPIDVKRGLESLKKIRKDAVYWNSGSESEQLMRTGEASIGVLWNTRAKILQEETKGKLTFTWNQGILQPAALPVLKGNPAGPMVQNFIASCCANADAQVGLLGLLGNGPTNPRAAEKVPEALKKYNATDPANAKVQLIFDGEWWGKNYTEVNQQYLDTIAG
jgi:putative spermidine/putrescine transport system substrate-binding protein